MRAYRIVVFFFLVAASVPASAQRGFHSRNVAPKAKLLKRVALTFDACPTHHRSGYDSLVIQTLIETKTPATLFLSGLWVKKHTRQTQFLSSVPQFEIANHSYSHPHLKEASDRETRSEIQKTNELLMKLGCKKPTFFRPPYGEFDERTERLVSEAGMRLIEYDVASGDPDTAISTQRLVRYVVNSVKHGSIVIMHMNQRGKHTAEALPVIIKQLREKGFELVKVSGLAAH